MRLIDADAFKNEIREIGNERFLETGDQEHLRIAEMVCHYVNKQPTIDPVKHGKWVYKPTSEYDGYIVCSNCDVYIPSHKLFGKDDEYTNTSNYCPHCGARMDGDK